MKRTCVFSLLLTMAALGAVACLNDGGDDESEGRGEACADGACDLSDGPDASVGERISLPDPGDEGDLVDAEQEFYDPGEAALWCGGNCGASDPNGDYICCYGTSCMTASYPEAGPNPPSRCCYALVYGYWGYPFPSQKCVTHISCYREDGAKLHPGKNLKCNDYNDLRCTSTGVLCDGEDDPNACGIDPIVSNAGENGTCGNADDVAL